MSYTNLLSISAYLNATKNIPDAAKSLYDRLLDEAIRHVRMTNNIIDFDTLSITIDDNHRIISLVYTDIDFDKYSHLYGQDRDIDVSGLDMIDSELYTMMYIFIDLFNEFFKKKTESLGIPFTSMNRDNFIKKVELSASMVFEGIQKEIPDEECKGNWHIVDPMIALGAFGKTYRACCEGACQSEPKSYVMKIVRYESETDKENFRNECQTAVVMGNFGLGPKVITYQLGERYANLIMRRLDFTLELFLKFCQQSLDGFMAISNTEGIRVVEELVKLVLAKVFEKIETLHTAGYYHGDLHLGNIMVYSHSKNYSALTSGYNAAAIASIRRLATDIEVFLIDFDLGGKLTVESEDKDDYNPEEDLMLVNETIQNIIDTIRVSKTVHINNARKAYDYSRIYYGLNHYVNYAYMRPFIMKALQAVIALDCIPFGS